MSQKQSNKPEIKTLEDLQREKIMLRGKIKEQEHTLNQHYGSLREKIKPALNIVNFLARNKLLNLIKSDPKEQGEGGIANTALKIIMAAATSGIILRNSKNNFLKSILAYALDQSAKFIKEKDLGEHLEKIKDWFSKKETDVEKDDI